MLTNQGLNHPESAVAIHRFTSITETGEVVSQSECYVGLGVKKVSWTKLTTFQLLVIYSERRYALSALRHLHGTAPSGILLSLNSLRHVNYPAATEKRHTSRLFKTNLELHVRTFTANDRYWRSPSKYRTRQLVNPKGSEWPAIFF